MKTREGPDKELELFSVPLICEPLVAQPISFCVEKYNHLARLELADSSNGASAMEVDVLIGSDYYWEFATGKTSRGESGPIAIHTSLGWILSGPVPSTETGRSSVSLVTTHTLRVDTQQHEISNLDDTLRSFWELESLGIKEPDRSVYTEFGENTCFRDGRYEVSLPWKDPHPTFPDNYQLSFKRLQGLLRRLRQNPTILQEYDSTIRHQIEQGIVEVVEDPQSNVTGRVHYLPHHAVIRRDKETTKLRIVYDASARSNGPSLNDCIPGRSLISESWIYC